MSRSWRAALVSVGLLALARPASADPNPFDGVRSAESPGDVDHWRAFRLQSDVLAAERSAQCNDFGDEARQVCEALRRCASEAANTYGWNEPASQRACVVAALGHIDLSYRDVADACADVDWGCMNSGSLEDHEKGLCWKGTRPQVIALAKVSGFFHPWASPRVEYLKQTDQPSLHGCFGEHPSKVFPADEVCLSELGGTDKDTRLFGAKHLDEDRYAEFIIEPLCSAYAALADENRYLTRLERTWPSARTQTKSMLTAAIESDNGHQLQWESETVGWDLLLDKALDSYGEGLPEHESAPVPKEADLKGCSDAASWINSQFTATVVNCTSTNTPKMPLTREHLVGAAVTSVSFSGIALALVARRRQHHDRVDQALLDGDIQLACDLELQDMWGEPEPGDEHAVPLDLAFRHADHIPEERKRAAGRVLHRVRGLVKGQKLTRSQASDLRVKLGYAMYPEAPEKPKTGPGASHASEGAEVEPPWTLDPGDDGDSGGPPVRPGEGAQPPEEGVQPPDADIAVEDADIEEMSVEDILEISVDGPPGPDGSSTSATEFTSDSDSTPGLPASIHQWAVAPPGLRVRLEEVVKEGRISVQEAASAISDLEESASSLGLTPALAEDIRQCREAIGQRLSRLREHEWLLQGAASDLGVARQLISKGDVNVALDVVDEQLEQLQNPLFAGVRVQTSVADALKTVRFDEGQADAVTKLLAVVGLVPIGDKLVGKSCVGKDALLDRRMEPGLPRGADARVAEVLHWGAKTAEKGTVIMRAVVRTGEL